MSEEFDFNAEDDGSKLSIKDRIARYVANWPFFVVSLAVCISAGYFYLKYTSPKYIALAMVVIKGQAAVQKQTDLVQTALTGQLKPDFNLYNELQVIKSERLLERVVAKNEFNLFYFIQGKLRKTDIYLDAPFRLISQNIIDSNKVIVLRLKNLNNKGGIIEYGADSKNSFAFKWNDSFKKNGQSFVLTPRSNKYDPEARYIVIWKPVEVAAREIKGQLSAGQLDKNTSIFTLTITRENVKQAKDIVDAVVQEYDKMDIEERNVISQNTIQFIDDRLNIVSNELSGVEGNIETYQGKNKVINLETQSSQSFGNSENVSQNITNINVQQGVVEMIKSYFNNPSTSDKLVPSTLGLNDATLSSLIGKYNDLQLTKQREAPLVAVNSTVMQDLDNQITNVRGSILEALQNITKNLRLQENNYEQQSSQYNQFLSSLPRKERIMQEMKRKQSITEGLYLYLLQKREEAAISSTSASVSNIKQIEPAIGTGPTEPNVVNISLFSVLSGLLIPVLFITGKDFLNDKVMSRKDLAKSRLNVLGDINHVNNLKNDESIVIKGADIVGEQYRIIRANLLSILKNKGSKVILVTSSIGTEGKSFVSLNLAAVLAISGKKVALLELDLRRPASLRRNLKGKGKGLSNYLTNETPNSADIRETVKDIPTLHIYSAGDVKSNPGDLLINERLNLLVENLKAQYDYIVIDSAPTAVVSDAFVLADFSDVTVYVVRQRVTPKKQLDYLVDLASTNKLKNLHIVFNDVKLGGKYGYQGYGYTQVYN